MMSILLDTCALIWLGNGDSALSLDARQVIEESVSGGEGGDAVLQGGGGAVGGVRLARRARPTWRRAR